MLAKIFKDSHECHRKHFSFFFINHKAHWPSYLSASMPTSHTYLLSYLWNVMPMPIGNHTYQPSCLSAIIPSNYILAIIPVNYHAHWPSYISAIMSISHHTCQLSYPSAIIPISNYDQDIWDVWSETSDNLISDK